MSSIDDVNLLWNRYDVWPFLRGSKSGCRSDGDILMAFFEFVALADVDG